MEPTEPDLEVTVVARRTLPLSSWLQIDEIDVRMPGAEGIETYHGIRQADAVSVLAMTPAGEFLLVRQYRPIIDAWTWELPAGAVDEGETPAEAGARELNEETGFRLGRMIPLGSVHEDPPRRTNKLFGFFALLESERDAHEAGMRSRLVSGPELRALAASGELAVPSQVALIWRAGLSEPVRTVLRTLNFPTPPWI